MPLGFDALLAAAVEARRAGDPARAAGLLERALADLPQDADPRLRVTAYRGLGHVQSDQALHDQALGSFMAAVTHARQQEDPCLLAHALRHAGRAAARCGRLADAIAACAEAMTLYRSHPDADPLDVANALRAQARVFEIADRRDEALAAWRAALPWYERAGIAAGAAECRARLG